MYLKLKTAWGQEIHLNMELVTGFSFNDKNKQNPQNTISVTTAGGSSVSLDKESSEKFLVQLQAKHKLEL